MKQPAAAVAGLLKNVPVLLLEGEMGAGKTTFVKYLLAALNSTDNATSPTFSIVNEYLYSGGKVFHFDLYRLKDLSELMDIGFDEYIDSGSLCLIEWPEIGLPLLAGSEVLKIKIVKEENSRYLSVETVKL